MKLIISCKDAIHIIRQQDILYCRSENSYSRVTLINGETLIVSKSLSKLTEQLSLDMFIRVNQSCVVNAEQISRIDRKKKEVELIGSEKVRFTIKVKTLLDSLGQVSGDENWDFR